MMLWGLERPRGRCIKMWKQVSCPHGCEFKAFWNADCRSKRSKAAMMAATVVVAAATAAAAAVTVAATAVAMAGVAMVVEVDTSNSRGIESRLKCRTQHGDKKGDAGTKKLQIHWHISMASMAKKKVSHILLSPIWVCRWIEDDLCVIADGITCFKYTETGPWPLENCEGMGKSMGFSDERGSAIFCHDFSILFVWLDLWSRNEIYPKHMRISHNFA